MIIVLDGPEKAGKSTLAASLVEGSPWPASIRKWGPINGKHELYLNALREDVLKFDELIVWDRSWASESVYCKLLPREGELGDDPFMGEWRYGRILRSVGLGVILTGPSVDSLRSLRDDTDHKVCPAAERRAFFRYATAFKWKVYVNQHTPEFLAYLTSEIIKQLRSVHLGLQLYGMAPPLYVGPQFPSVVVLGEPRVYTASLTRRLPSRDAWAPFGSRLTSRLGYALGPSCLEYGWSNINICNDALIRETRTIVACGENVLSYLKLLNDREKLSGRVIPTPHPAWLFRYGAGLRKSNFEIEKLRGELRHAK